jgi:hypothetical protein
MYIDTMKQTPVITGGAADALRYEDPLDQDSHDDALLVTTRRGLLRVALVAAETASRFVREAEDVDPMAWMLAPRRLFAGRAAIDACLDRDECLRGILLHGLSIGLDADPDEIDALGGDDDQDRIDDLDEIEDQSDTSDLAERAKRPRLWTSLLVGRCEADEVQAFDAVVADDRFEAEARLRARHGAALAGELQVVEGFDPNLPLVEALVSSALADILVQVASDPASPLAKGLSVSVKQRFAA